MGGVIGDVLPLALGVAISPVPIIAVILMLLAPDARAASIAYLLGWVTGITVVVVVVTLVVDPVDSSEPGAPSTFSAVLTLVVGLLFLTLAARSWRHRPRAGQEPTMPSWMGAIAGVTPLKACGLGLLLSAANPKNLALGIAAGSAIGSGADDVTTAAVGVLTFVLVASASIAVPVIGNVVAEQRMRPPLDELRRWLTLHNSAVMSVLMLVLGVDSIGKGIAAF
jgi:threonine/homoserine/homoserine lactone efflux protein